MHHACMTVITVRHVPESLNDRLKERAAERGQSMQQFLLSELESLSHRSPIEARLARLLAELPLSPVPRSEIEAIIEEAKADRV